MAKSGSGEFHQVLINETLIDVDVMKVNNCSYVIPIGVEAQPEAEIAVEDLMVEELLEESGDSNQDPNHDIEMCDDSNQIVEVQDEINNEDNDIDGEPLIIEDEIIEEWQSHDEAEEAETPDETPCDQKVLKKNICDTDQNQLGKHIQSTHKIAVPNVRKQRDSRPNDVYFGLDMTRTCEYCFEEFADINELDLHLMAHHDAAENPPLYTCRVCKCQLKTKVSLRNHYTYRHTETERQTFLYPCTSCGREFKTKASRKAHFEVQHLGITKKYKCAICGLRYNNRSDLTRHNHRHTGNKPHVCTYEGCDKR